MTFINKSVPWLDQWYSWV